MQIRLPANLVAVIMKPLAPFTPNSPKSLCSAAALFYGRGLPQATMDAGDGIHPNRDAQPFIADWMAKRCSL